MLEKILRTVERFIPKRVYRFFQPAYHYCLALLGALLYRFPGRDLTLIGVTGTKGKSTTVELLGAMLRAEGYTTATLSTIGFRINDAVERNLYKMTLPGRFFLPSFLRRAVRAGCTHAVVELTSEGSRQFRHKFLSLDGLVVTNLSPEHIESHGSFERYKEAKLDIARELARSKKARRYIVVPQEGEHGENFARAAGDAERHMFSLDDAAPYEIAPKEISLTWRGSRMLSLLFGEFNLKNIIAAATMAEAMGVSPEHIKRAVENERMVRGRAEEIEEGQAFRVIVDYAHTPDSLTEIYKAIPEEKICVLGGTGGGRDAWKRPEMGRIADRFCSAIIVTNEDPYDENPLGIASAVASGVYGKKVDIIMDRRAAITRAFERAKKKDGGRGVAVVITGKGTDPYIMGARGEKTPWDDATVAREELAKLLK